MVLQGQDAWRRHPLFQNTHRAAFPGLKKAVVIFGTYLVLETAYKKITHKNTFDPSALSWSKDEIGVKPELQQ